MSDTRSTDFTAFDKYIDDNFDSMVEELRTFCSTPTLAGQRVGLEEGVAAVRALLEPLGAVVNAVPLEGGAPPVVLAELGAGLAPSCSTTTTTCSRPTRSTCGTRRPTRAMCATASSMRGAWPTTGATSYARVQAIRAYQAAIGAAAVAPALARRGRRRNWQPPPRPHA